MSMGRQFWVVAHRWAGLTIAVFLTIAGFTGAFLAFMDELDAWFAPNAHLVSPPTPDSRPLDSVELRERVRTLYPGAVINYLPLHVEPGHTVMLGVDRIDPATGRIVPWSPEIDEAFVDPYTGNVVATRLWGDPTQGAINAMSFLYRLHYTLASGNIGRYAFGIAALIWTLDCFLGFYLTLPQRRRREPGATDQAARPWWSRWKPSWLVRWSGGQHKLTFDLHRAGGLWVWPLLFVFAWSSVSFNLDEVYDPVMKLFGQEQLLDGVTPLPKALHAPKLDFRAAAEQGREHARLEAQRRGLTLEPERFSALLYRPKHGVYVYYFSTDRDFTNRGGRTMVLFDANSGELRKTRLPQGQNGANTFTHWILALHMASVWGLPYRIVVSALGLIVTMLSVTGVLIWMKKREARSLAAIKLGRARGVVAQ
jgi:uncharacterized iron-regulated membrane protein